MAVFNDLTQLNDCSNAGDWTTGGSNAPDSPKLNDSSSTVPYYIEGNSCMDFPLKSNADGYTYDGVTSYDQTGRVFVWWFWFPGPDVDGLPLNTFAFRLSSSSGFTSNYDQWDVKNFLAERPGSFVPIKVWPTNPDTTSGSPDLTSVVSYGVVVATGGTDNKAAAFDQVFHINYIGGHSETFTNTYFDRLVDDATNGAEAEVIGIYTRSGDFFQTSINLALGSDGSSGRPSSTANMVVDETGKTVFFDNIESDHPLGYICYNPNGGNENRLALTRVVHFWNDQPLTADIFQNPGNLDRMQIDACSFTNGGRLQLRAWISDALTFMTGCTITGCGRVEPNTMLFENNVIQATNSTAADSGALLLDSTSNRVADCTFIKGTAASHAIVITTPGTYTFSGLDFQGYNAANGNADSTIRNESGGSVTINATGVTGNLSFQNGTGASTTINAGVPVTVTAQDVDGNPIEGAKVFLEETPSGTDVISYAITNASGVVSTTFSGGTPQAVTGFVRKGSSSPVYKAANINDTISGNGLAAVVTLVLDE